MCAFASIETGGPEVLKIEEVDLSPAGQGRGEKLPSRDRGQLPRHLPPHRLLPDAPAPDPGGEGAGEVLEAGAGVKDFNPAIGSSTQGRRAATPRRGTFRQASSSSCRAGSTSTLQPR